MKLSYRLLEIKDKQKEKSPTIPEDNLDKSINKKRAYGQLYAIE